MINILVKSPDPEKSLTNFFESMGYEYTWDFRQSDGEQWHEFIDPDTHKLTIQIGFGVTKDEFLEAWFDDDNPAPFFVGGNGDSEEWKTLKEKIDSTVK